MNWQAATFFSTACLAAAGLVNAWILQSIKLQIVELEKNIREWAHKNFATETRVDGLEKRVTHLEQRPQ